MTTSFAPITFEGISVSKLTKQLQAEIRQVVTVSYPTTRYNTSTSDALFSAEVLGDEGKPFKSTRVYWLKVTEKITDQMMLDALAANPEARIMRTLTSSPMFSDEHVAVINAISYPDVYEGDQLVKAGEPEREALERSELRARIANSQMVKHGKKLADGSANPQADKAIIPQGGCVQYRRYDFKLSAEADVDLRLTAVQLLATAQ